MNPELQPFIESLGLEYTAVFVPQSASRNSAEKQPTLNWCVTLRKATYPAGTIATDYIQGIGHVPGIPQTYGRGETNSVREFRLACEEAAELGTYPPRMMDRSAFGYDSGRKPLPPPPLLDVLHSLLLDGEADDYTFDEWCDNFGYDTDSRTAERTYNECREIGTKLRRMLGGATLARLRELFQDY